MTPLEALRALGPDSEAPLEARERVYGALLASLSVTGGRTVESASPAAQGRASLAAGPAGPAASASALAGVTSSKLLGLAAAIWLFGGATGAALYGALRPPTERVVYRERPAPSSVPIRAVPPSSASAGLRATASAAPSSGISAGHSALLPGTASSASSQLTRERQLLDLARADAAHGEPALVLEQAAQHRRLFPHGHLSEEREALAIRALLALGRDSEARERANAFRAAYPHSFLEPVIDSALAPP